MRKLLVIAGVPIDDLTMEEALLRVGDFIASRRPHQVATVNADFIVKAWDDQELRYILQGADLLTADGMPLVWGARLLGVPLEGRVTGADMVPALAARGAEKGWRFFFLGARAGVAAQAAERLTHRHPQLQIVGIESPPVSPVVEMDPALIDRIRQVQPDILLVAFGNPKQEKWIHMHLAELGVPVCIGVGGTLDFIAGQVRRAPLWMQRYGLEWLYRMLQEPRRMWKRYVVDIFQFSRFFLGQWWRQRGGRKLAVIELKIELPEANPPSGLPVAAPTLHLSGPLTVAHRAEIQSKIETALAQFPRLTLDMTEVTFIDSAAFGALVHATKQARSAQGDLVLRGFQPALRASIAMLRLDTFFTLETADKNRPADKSHPMGASAPIQAAVAGPAGSRAAAPGTAVFPLPRRVDVAASPALRLALEQALLVEAHLVLECSTTEFIDSAGIAVLLHCQRQAHARGGGLVLAALSRQARRTLELSGVASLFQFSET